MDPLSLHRTLAPAVTLAVVMAGGGLRAADFDDPRCRLAEPARAGVQLFQPPGGSEEASRPPARCPFDKTMSSTDDAVFPAEEPRLICQSVTACGRPMQVLRVGEKVYLANPRDYRVVEDQAERSDRPTVQLRSPDASCMEASVRSHRSWFFPIDGDNIATARITDARPLERDTVVAACRFVGAHVIGWHDGTRGLIRAADLAPSCAMRADGYFGRGDRVCRLPAWTGRTTKTAFLYPLDEGAPGAKRGAVPAGAELTLRSRRPGVNARLDWFEVDWAGRRGLVNADAIEVGGVTTYLPEIPVADCPDTAILHRTTCRLTLDVRRFSDPGQMAGAPRSVKIESGVLLPVLPARSGERLGHVFGLSVMIGQDACLEPTADSLALSAPPERNPSSGAAGGCSLASAREELGELPVSRLMGYASEEAEELAILIAKSERADNLAGPAHDIYAEARLTAGDFAYLSSNGSTDRIFVAIVRGEDGHLSPLHRAVYEAFGMVEARGASAPEVPWHVGAQCKAGDAPSRPEADALAFAEKALRRGHALLAREAFAALLDTTRNDVAAADALAGYREAALEAGPSRAALPTLTRLCTDAHPLLASDACWLGALAADEHGLAAEAAALRTRLAAFKGLSARKLMDLALADLASGKVNGAVPAAQRFLEALKVARARCGDCGELAPAIELALIRAAHDAEEYELAHELLLGLPAPHVVRHLDVAFSVLASLERFDDLLSLADAAGWGARGGVARPTTAMFWGAVALDRACSFGAAATIADAVEGTLNRRREAVAAVPRGPDGAPTAAPSWWDGEDAVGLEAPAVTLGRDLPEVGELWGRDGPCGMWRRNQDELGALDPKTPDALRRRAEAGLAASEAVCRGALASALAAAPDETNTMTRILKQLRIDADDHVVRELQTGDAILSRLDEVAMARIRQDADGRGRGRDAKWGRWIRRLPWPVALASRDLEAVNGLLQRRGEKPLTAPRLCKAARELATTEYEGEDETEFAARVGKVDARVKAAVACVQEGLDAELDEGAMALLVRYLPALQLATGRDLKPLDMDELPRSVRETLRKYAGRNERRQASCCLTSLPGAVELLETTDPSEDAPPR